jgi:hypothetical protein
MQQEWGLNVAGLLNSTEQQPAAGNTLVDPILQQIEKGIDAAVPPELKKPYMQIVTAGMKVMFDKKTSKYIEQRINEADDIPAGVASGIADLLLLLYNESKRTMSIPAAMLAAFSLMAQALDYAEKTGKLDVTPELVDKCTEATWQAVTTKFGITKDKIDAVVAQSQSQQGAQPAGEEPQAPPQAAAPPPQQPPPGA